VGGMANIIYVSSVVPYHLAYVNVSVDGSRFAHAGLLTACSSLNAHSNRDLGALS
jgi:hypothetical protein